MVDDNTETQLESARSKLLNVYNGKETVNQQIYPHLRRSSVLICLFIKNEVFHVLLTVRSKNTPTNKGQVAFPGGLRSLTDTSDIETALREAEEEVGLPPDAVEVLCKLPLSYTEPKTAVTPVIGIISKEFVPIIDPKEVDAVFSVPLIKFLDFNVRKEVHYYYRRGILAFTFDHNVNGKIVPIYGFTAALCTFVAAIVFDLPRLPPIFHMQHNPSPGYFNEMYEFYTFMAECSKYQLPNVTISKL